MLSANRLVNCCEAVDEQGCGKVDNGRIRTANAFAGFRLLFSFVLGPGFPLEPGAVVSSVADFEPLPFSGQLPVHVWIAGSGSSWQPPGTVGPDAG
jgi:hypothetical protein